MLFKSIFQVPIKCMHKYVLHELPVNLMSTTLKLFLSSVIPKIIPSKYFQWISAKCLKHIKKSVYLNFIHQQ